MNKREYLELMRGSMLALIAALENYNVDNPLALDVRIVERR